MRKRERLSFEQRYPLIAQWAQFTLPKVYDESMTMSQALYNLRAIVIEISIAFDEMEKEWESFQEELLKYAQEEIGKQLQDWLDDGTLANIITSYIFSTHTYSFNTAVALTKDKTLSNGNRCKTLGYYNEGDGGHGEYIILPTGVEDGGSCIKLANGVYAHYIPIENEMSIKCWGIKEKDSIDKILKYAIPFTAKNDLILVIEGGTYNIDQWSILESNLKMEIKEGTTLIAIHEENSFFSTFDYTTLEPGYKGKKNIHIFGKGIINMNAGGVGMEDSGASVIRLGHATNVIIEGITITNWNKYHAIEVGGCDGVLIKDVTFKGAMRSTDIYREAIQIETVTEEGLNGALPYDRTPSRNIEVNGCKFISSELANCNVGIGSHGDNTKTFENIKIIDCYFENLDSACIRMMNWKNVEISGNKAFNCKSSFVGIKHNDDFSASNIMISNNYVDGIGSPVDVPDNLSEQFSICLNRGENATVVNNIIKNSYWGILKLEQYDGVIIDSNVFDEICLVNDVLNTDKSLGILVGRDISGWVVSNMSITNNIFKSTVDKFLRPFGIYGESNNASNKIEGNTFNFKNVSSSAYGRMFNIGVKYLYIGKVQFGDIDLNENIELYDEVIIKYDVEGVGAFEYQITNSKPTNLINGNYGITQTINNGSGTVVDINNLIIDFRGSKASIIKNVRTRLSTDNAYNGAFPKNSNTIDDRHITITEIIAKSTNLYTKR